MNISTRRSVFTFGLFISLLLPACNAITGQDGESIKASGVIEVTTITLSSEVGGSVSQILAQEGEEVGAGQALIQLDSALLEAQLTQAEAELAAAQASYDQIEAASAIERILAQEAIDDLHAYADVARAEKMLEIANLRDAVKDAERRLNSLEQGGKQTDIDSARANVVLLADQLEDAQEDYQDFAGKPETNLTKATLQLKLSEAQGRYDDAVRLLNNLEADANSVDLAIAEANLLLAESSLLVAESELEELQDGPDPDALALAEARLQTANSTVALAQSQVDAASAAVDLLRVQVEKSRIVSPIDGLVLNALVEIGEIVFPGTPLVLVSNPSEITITVFVPEDRYGKIGVGDVAELTVDSFEDEIFKATVTHIADEAEYTPRNVQTEEDRRTTVFAIELSITDAEGKLKSGMPGDVVFQVD